LSRSAQTRYTGALSGARVSFAVMNSTSLKPQLKTLISAMLVALVLCACGQRGDLTLPEDPAKQDDAEQQANPR